jgi:hypothetical protein
VRRSILQIIPAAPPAVSGVGDFAVGIARALRDELSIDTTFLACGRSQTIETHCDFPVVSVSAGDEQRFLDALRSSEAPVFLHLSGYGYALNGAPSWLHKALTTWKSRAPQARLGTFFHELYATGYPWQRAFWNSPLQRACTRRIARLSDFAVTNTERFEAQLARWDPSKRDNVPVLPVASNVGEPRAVPGPDSRGGDLVVWGSSISRGNIFSRYGGLLEHAVEKFDIQRVVAVGPGDGGAPRDIGGVPVHFLGLMPVIALSSLLAQARLGAFFYNPNFLCKSTLYAGFCAHGVASLCLPNRVPDARNWDGLIPRTHFLASSEDIDATSSEALSSMGVRCHSWYAGHRLHEHARVVATMMVKT